MLPKKPRSKFFSNFRVLSFSPWLGIGPGRYVVQWFWKNCISDLEKKIGRSANGRVGGGGGAAR